MSKLTGMITVQRNANGMTNEERLNSLKTSLTPSAHALSKALGFLKKDDNKSPSDKTAVAPRKTTETYHFEIEAESAIKALQSIDSTGNTESYDRKRSALDEVLGTKNIRSLPLADKIGLYEKIRPFSFTSYSFQVSIRVPEEDPTVVKFIHTKKHHRLEALTEKTAKAIMDRFNVTWVDDNPKGTNPDGEKEEATPS